MRVAIYNTAAASQMQQWEYALCNFAPSNLYIIGAGGPWSKYLTFSRIDHASEIEGPVVVLAPTNGEKVRGKTSLEDFCHPPNCTYLFGSNNAHLTPEDLEGANVIDCVYIKTDTKDQMYAWLAYGVVAWDRRKYGYR